jgi:hypothetical protein
MTHLFADYEVSTLVKDKGFDANCLGFFRNDTKKLLINNTFAERAYLEDRVSLTQAPLWNQIIEWLWSKYQIFLSPEITYDSQSNIFYYTILYGEFGKNHLITTIADDTANARRLAILHALTLI